MTASDPDGAARMQADLERLPYLDWLSVRIVDATPGGVTLRIPYKREITNAPRPDGSRIVHGGVVATAVDVAGITAVGSAYDDEVGTTTADLNVSYLRPATGDLVARGTVVRTGGSLGVARVTVESTDEEGEAVEVAAGRVSIRVWTG